MVIDWHGVTERFHLVSELKKKLSESLTAYVPDVDDFNVGYFHGRPQVKSWIVSEEDVLSMYSSASSKEIILWCDGKDPDKDESGRRRKRSTTGGENEEGSANKRASTAQAYEIELEENVSKLQAIHEDKYDYGQYRLWSRLLIAKQWKDFNNPPRLLGK